MDWIHCRSIVPGLFDLVRKRVGGIGGVGIGVGGVVGVVVGVGVGVGAVPVSDKAVVSLYAWGADIEQQERR